MSLDLWKDVWRDEMITKARKERDVIAKSYASLHNKDTDYARSQKIVLNVREAVLSLWQASPKDCATPAQGGGWQKLSDSDWGNIVNAPSVLEHSDDAEVAVCEAVRLTEARLKALNG